MKFSTAWARTAAQNVTLKVATAILAVVVIIQLISIMQLATKEPLVIERACFSRVLTAKPSDPTNEDIRGFLSESLPMRFDSVTVVKSGFFSLEETAAREKEQAMFKQRQMVQRLLISDIKIDGKTVTVSSDRVISIGKIRSALPLVLKITLEQTNRTESNPYGLILSSISQIEEKDDKQ